jgi:CRISPR-associated protein Cmr2
METYLFQVNIGPVQGFIASARRTRDLWFGSALLSRLAMEAAMTIKSARNTNILIFPSERLLENAEQNKNISVPNKILALINVENASEVNQLGKMIHDAINTERNRIKEIAYGKVNKQFKEIAYEKFKEQFFDIEMANEQIADLIEYRWVALQYTDKGYDDTRKRLELLMAARKNAYNFEQVPWGGQVAKSSIDGKLECVISQKYYPRRSYPPSAEQLKAQRDLFSDFQASPSERLSGVDLLKRRGDFDKESENGFPSTSHIATIPYLERLRQLKGNALYKATTAWREYIQGLKELKSTEPILEYVKGYYREDVDSDHPLSKHPILKKHDGALLFPEHFLDIVPDKNTLNGPRKKLDAFFKEVEQQLSSDRSLRPQPYYAILQADGDGMGKVIDHQAEQESEGHQKLSRKIDDFAEEARKIVAEYLGATIYAGGDDVLALVPLHKVLACAAKLSKRFKTLLNDFEDKDGDKPSLSVGIAIVHHLELLSEALNVARRAEKKAKGYKKKKDEKWLKKDALAIIVSKRSGEEYDIAGRWGDLNSFLGQLIGYYRDGIIPKGTAYELRESALRLSVKDLDLTPKETDPPKIKRSQDVLLAEAERILQRKLLVGQGKSSNREKAEQTLGLLEQRLGIPKELTKGKWDAEPVEITSTIEEFVHELVIAEMLADAERLAGTQEKEDQK